MEVLKGLRMGTWALRLFLTAWLCATMQNLALAEEDSPQFREYLVKAAFIYNFTKFIDWPPEAFQGDTKTFCLGVLGKDPFGDALKSLHGKEVKGRRLVIKRFATLEEMDRCHILFISSSERGRFPEILGRLKHSSILTISDVEGFVQKGGVVNFIRADHKVHFEINPEAASQAGLKVGSQLLKLAKIAPSQS